MGTSDELDAYSFAANLSEVFDEATAADGRVRPSTNS